ncbi:OmpH family outer membrane protein [bacterium]|nr:OmpH family outer membrane protein [bacterium]
MKKQFVTLLALGLLFGTTSVFAAETLSKGIAVVDVQKVVMNSAKVKKLEQDRIKQEQDLKKFLTDAKKKIDAESDETKKKALQEKYNKEVSQKINSQRKDVATKTQNIETDILNAVQKHAKANGYDVVITKGSVLYGGDDITEEVIKQVK